MTTSLSPPASRPCSLWALLAPLSLLGIVIVTVGKTDLAHSAEQGQSADEDGGVHPLGILDGVRAKPVCIIGAGPAGLWAAYKLEEMGRKAVVFEKRDEVGGKVRSYDINGTKIDVGAVIFNANAKNPLVEFVNATGIEYYGTPAFGERYDFLNDTVVPFSDLVEPALLPSAVQTYAQLYQKYARYTVPATLTAKIPRELALDAESFLFRYNMQALAPILQLYVTSFGYRRLVDVPMIYVYKELSPAALGAIIQGGTTSQVKDGFQSVFEVMAETLEDVRLGVDITKVRRFRDHARVFYKNSEGARRQQQCSSVIVAFPQHLQDMGFLGLDRKERAVFSQVQRNPYYTIVAQFDPPLRPKIGLAWHYRDPEDDPLIPGRELLIRDGKPMAASRPRPNLEDVHVFYSGNVEMTQSEMEAGVKGDYPTRNASFLEFFEYPEYFPHVDGCSLRNGFYADLHQLQGYRSTYYAGGLLSFDMVPNAMETSQFIVENYMTG